MEMSKLSAAVVLLLMILQQTHGQACYVQWTSEVNRNYANGRQNSASTLQLCQSACISNAGCNGLDWFPTAAQGSRCWLSGTWSGARGSVTHHALDRNCQACHQWTSQANTKYADGRQNVAGSLALCQSACVSTGGCSGVDWEPTAAPGSRCWLTGVWSGAPSSETGVTHYDLNRNCQACQQWTTLANTSYANGRQNSASTLQLCQSACISNAGCNGFDWVPTAAQGLRCWLSGTWSGARGQSGITHYILNETDCPRQVEQMSIETVTSQFQQPGPVPVTTAKFLTTAAVTRGRPDPETSAKFVTTAAEGPSPSEISVDSVWPLYGPVAGGTRVTITGQYLSNVTDVYFGQHQGFIDKHSSQLNSLVVTTPRRSDDAVNQPLVISIVLKEGPELNTSHRFIYHLDPRFSNIEPRSHLLVGGTAVTVTGSHLNSVAEPRITLTVIVTNNNVISLTNSTSESCNIPQDDPGGNKMLCRMPAVGLPNNLREELIKSEFGTINNTQGPGVAVYVSSDGRTRADIYVGLKLDGLELFQNISSVNSSIEMQFSLKPVVSCQSDVLAFNSDADNVITIQGQDLRRGSRLMDFDIRLGDSVCVPVSLTDTKVDCRPPTNKPNRNINDTFCQDDTLSSSVQIGNAYYNCSCVRYVLSENSLWLIVGLSAGCGILLIIIIIIIVSVVCRRRRSKATKETHKYDDIRARSIELELQDDNRHYCTIPAATPQCDDNAYSSLQPEPRDENKQYTALVLPTPNTNKTQYESPYTELGENRYASVR